MSRREKEKSKIRYTNAKETAQKQQAGFELSSVKVPKGMPVFRFKREGLYRLIVVPYLVGEGNPMADPGMVHWERSYYAHGQVGPENKRYTCPQRTATKRCPIHDHANLVRKEGGDPELIKDLEKAGKRQIMLIIDLDEKDKGLQVYEGPYTNGLGELIDNKIDATDEDSPYRNFFYLDDRGMKLTVKAKQDSFQGRSFFKPVNVEMEIRKSGIVSEDLLDDAPCLDEMILILPYDELKDIFLQTGEEGEEEEVKPKKRVRDEEEELEETEEENEEEEAPKTRKSKKEKTAEECGLEEGEIVTYKKVEYEVKKISSDGTSLILETEDGDLLRGISPEDVKIVPTKSSKPPAGKKKADLDEDDDLDEEEDSELEPLEEDEPVKVRRKKPPVEDEFEDE